MSRCRRKVGEFVNAYLSAMLSRTESEALVNCPNTAAWDGFQWSRASFATSKASSRAVCHASKEVWSLMRTMLQQVVRHASPIERNMVPANAARSLVTGHWSPL